MTLTIILILAAVSIWAFRARIFRATPAAASPTTAATRSRTPRAAAPDDAPARAGPFAGPGPDLEMIEWQAHASGGPGDAPANSTPAKPGSPEAFRSDSKRSKLRDRYIQARFPGVVGSGSDLEDHEKIVTAVRLYFEEQKFDRADELLEIAIGQSPQSKPLRLAQLELAFLRREGERFVVFARDFRRAHPDAAQWREIARLGRVIAPMETSLFGEAQGEHHHDRYGPWPEMPNWLQASFDLTTEVLAADFHRDMAHS
jgi:hypothetical protein